MSNVTSVDPVQYSVWVNGRTVRGSAKSVLQDIQRHARPESEVGRRTVEDYANTLITDAVYFFPDGRVPWLLLNKQYSSKFEQALEYLALMPSSGLHILSVDER